MSLLMLQISCLPKNVPDRMRQGRCSGDDPFKRNNLNAKTVVLLTNGVISKPLKVCDTYNALSEIKNSMFREGEQEKTDIRKFREKIREDMRYSYLVGVMLLAPTEYLNI